MDINFGFPASNRGAQFEMIITHISCYYHPILGGMERVVQRLAEEQVRMNHEVHVITSTLGPARALPRKDTVNGVSIHRVNAIKFFYSDLTYPMECPEQVLKESDIIHVHSQNSLFNITLAMRASRMEKSIIMDFVGMDYLKSHPNLLIRFFGSYYQGRIQSKAAKLVDAAVTVNERDYRILKEKYSVESTVIPFGLDEEYLMKPKNERVFREKYGIYDKKIIAYVGRIQPLKGLDILIEAVPLVLSNVDDFVVIIAGGGSESYRKKLVRIAEKLGVKCKVKIFGYITEDEKISLLDSSKVFVLPTRHFGENYSLVVDEAYARCVPVVATKVGVLPYRIKHMETGMLVPPGDPSSLANALIALIKENGLLTRMGKGLLSARSSLLTWTQVCARLDNIYNSVKVRKDDMP